MTDHCLQRAGLGKQVARARNDFQSLRAFQPRQCLLVEFNDNVVGTADDQEGWHPKLVQHIAGEIGTPTTGNDGIDPITEHCGGNQSSRGSGAGAEQAEPVPACPGVAVEPMHGIDKPLRQQTNIENIRSIGFLFRGQEIEQQGRKSLPVQSLGNGDIAGAETARTAAVREYDDGMPVAGKSQRARQPDRPYPHVTNLDVASGSA
jgi:hypothetical protein